jgi:hypothetical protein
MQPISPLSLPRLSTQPEAPAGLRSRTLACRAGGQAFRPAARATLPAEVEEGGNPGSPTPVEEPPGDAAQKGMAGRRPTRPLAPAIYRHHQQKPKITGPRLIQTGAQRIADAAPIDVIGVLKAAAAPCQRLRKRIPTSPFSSAWVAFSDIFGGSGPNLAPPQGNSKNTCTAGLASKGPLT